MMNKMAKCALALAMMIVLVVLPVAAMAVDVDTYDEFKAALIDGEKEINITGDFEVEVTTDKKILTLPAGGSLKGNGHTITLKRLDNNGNGNYVFKTGGNCVIENVIFDASELAYGIRVADLTSGDIMREVKIIGNSKLSFGVVASGIGQKVTIEDCEFQHVKQAIYVSEDTNPTVTVTDSNFEDCETAIIMRGDDSEFINNTVADSKLNVIGSTEVSGNTFEGETRVKFYFADSAKEFSNNKIMDDSFIAVDSSDITDLGDKNYGNYCENADTALKEAPSAIKDAALEGSMYEITVKTAQNGTVSAPATAAAGEKVTLTVKPNSGYQVKSITTNVAGVAVKDNAFTMPTSNVTITVEFEAVLPEATPVPNTSDLPKTGDNSNIMLFATLLTMSAAGMLLLMRRRSTQR